MRLLISSVLAVALMLVVGARTALAQVHVPGDYATIQAAINSGAPLIYVGTGTWYETLAIDHSVTLLPEPPADSRQPTPFPNVSGMNITITTTDLVVYVRGFRFTNTVTQTNSSRAGVTTIEGCKLDGGFWTYGSSGLGVGIKIRSCVITGNVYVYSYYNEFTGNMVWKGQADIHSNGGNGALIRDNLVIGPSPAGLLSTSGDTPGSMTGNIVSGVTTGYSVVYGTVANNVAVDCGGAGFATSLTGGGYGGQRTFTENSALRCGVGFDLTAGYGGITVNANSVDSSKTYGIHEAPGVPAIVTSNVVRHSALHGIWMEGHFGPTYNTVLFSGGNGIRSQEVADWNVVGRSLGDGIVAPAARHNTAYLNVGAGLNLNGAAPDTISHNIAYGNGTYGLVWIGTGTPQLGCNDWFGNAAGPTSGVSPGATDIAANPLFCDLPSENVSLSSSSPCASAGSCGQIGAWSVGCGAADAPQPSETTVRFSVYPNPANGSVEMRWPRGSAPSRIEVFDLSGALRLRTDLPPEATAFRWTNVAGVASPGGVYFVRRTAGDVVEHARVVILH